ncbi:hypothetical protein H6F77_12560 [Microcoleus sp. FACHB-831]|uniref:hypothetical protein n=1 Tax=Microcoleus sp. FACHB-831 TaxID=2692827 RepID=UPI001682C8E4|nr:hypothetical protein [Microcoleus sp. FACHB-831]MBD1921918.1 hypothetical protein [Microcoleus sp. FACHB-831]
MSAVSQNRWYSLRLASIAIALDGRALADLSQKLTKQHTDSEIAQIWREARILLTEEDNCWLEEEMYHLLVQDSEAAA